MATVEALPAKARPVVKPPGTRPEQQFLLDDLSWGQYRAISDALDETRVRINYDRGRLELMTISSLHEWLKKLVGRFIEALTLELRIAVRSAGSWTLRREALNRGAESDDCYYVQNEPAVRGRDHIDLETDPPPDLGVEIEVSRSLVDRLGIFAAMRVPEIWCCDGARLRVQLLSGDGRYVESDRSRCFPFLPIREVEAFLNRRHEMDETSLVDAFRRWVREQDARGWPA